MSHVNFFFFFDKICIVLLKCWLIKYILTFPKIQLVLSHGFDEAFFFILFYFSDPIL